MPQANGPRNHQVNETRPRSGQNQGDRHHEHAEAPESLTQALLCRKEKRQTERQGEYNRERHVVGVRVETSYDAVQAGNRMSFCDSYEGDNRNRGRLEEDDSLESGQSCNEEKSQNPCHVDLGKIQGSKKRAASPDRRQKCTQE